MKDLSSFRRKLIACAALCGLGTGGCLWSWSSCDLGEPTVLSAAIQVQVRDAATGQPVDRVRIIASDGEYRTYLLNGSGGIGWGAYRPGIYTIEAYADGYVPARQENVVVESHVVASGECPDPVLVIVDMTMPRE